MRFERETCTRCGGTGRHSFNLKDGSKCYGCNGKGEKLTKRGSAANKWMAEQLTIPVESVVVGDRLRDGGTRFTVLSIEVKENGSVSFGAKFEGKPWSLGFLKGSKIKTIPSDERRSDLLAKAIEYQNTLTKQGKPRKKRGV